jgi:hypothetical protein
MALSISAGRTISTRRRWLIGSAVLVLATLATPVPWLLPVDHSWGMVWKLDGRLTVNGVKIDPAGQWSWLTAGRPPLVAEVLVSGVGGTRDIRGAPVALRPSANERTAAAVGMAHAGINIDFGLIVEAIDPFYPQYPQSVRVIEFNGVPLVDFAAWSTAAAMPTSSFRTLDGTLYEMGGDGLPYHRVYFAAEVPPQISAAVGGRLATTPPVSWFRDMGLGSSHGLIVALSTYAYVADPQLADGIHVAATGGVRSDGTVTRIGGLMTKANAAKRAGVDVLFFPASQLPELIGFNPGNMDLVPVANLGEAVAYLEAREIS